MDADNRLILCQLSPLASQFPIVSCHPRLSHPAKSTSVHRRQQSSVAVAQSKDAAVTAADSSDPATELEKIRLPRAVQATYLTPLRRQAQYGIPSCDLQLRSYSIRNLEVFADFAMRAAYYLNLPAKGPVPLPKITERWTVPRSNFVHKKSQENFERITVRRLIQIQDGHPETVSVWLGFLQKYRYYGIGMKANVWERGGLEVAKDLDAEAERISERLGEKLELVGSMRKKWMLKDSDGVKDSMMSEPFKAAWGAYAPMSGAQSVPNADKRVEQRVIE